MRGSARQVLRVSVLGLTVGIIMVAAGHLPSILGRRQIAPNPNVDAASHLGEWFPKNKSRSLGETEPYSVERSQSGFVFRSAHANDAASAAEKSFAGGLDATFPATVASPVSFLVGPLTISVVREEGLEGQGRSLGQALVYDSVTRAAFWTAHKQGFEEWLFVHRAPSGPIGAWRVQGAKLLERAGHVETLDETGIARMEVRADQAFMEGDIPIKVSLKVDGERILAFLPPDVHGKRVLVDPLWVMTGALTVPRKEHTATLLPNGKVLAVGGQNGSTYLSSAELYNPTTGTFTATGSLSMARTRHTATLLQSGKVLVAGGEGSGGILGTAELYDPATGTAACDRITGGAHAPHGNATSERQSPGGGGEEQQRSDEHCAALRSFRRHFFQRYLHPRSAPASDGDTA